MPLYVKDDLLANPALVCKLLSSNKVVLRDTTSMLVNDGPLDEPSLQSNAESHSQRLAGPNTLLAVKDSPLAKPTWCTHKGTAKGGLQSIMPLYVKDDLLENPALVCTLLSSNKVAPECALTSQ